MSQQLTPEQNVIIAAARNTNDSLIIDAKAGSGKTTTLVKMLAVLKGSTTIQAFNKAIATEIEAKANAANLPFQTRAELDIRTVHSHGLSAFRKAGLRPQTQSGKVAFMVKDELKARYSPDDDLHRNSSKVVKLIGMAKAHGFGLTSDYENFPDINHVAAWFDLGEHFGLWDELLGDTTPSDVIELAIRLLKIGNTRTTTIDFDDMIYLPLLHNFPLPQYDNVLLDEAQDINATRREMAFRTVKAGGRLIAVGDPNQAIYGFTGADVASLAKIKARAKAETLTLSICWRCDEAIIKEAQKEVPSIQPCPDAAPGQVVEVPFIGKQTGMVELGFFDFIQPGDAVLCRLNKPNIAAALGLLRRGFKPRIEGRDIGKKILSHGERANDGHASISLRELLLDIENYREREVELLLRKNREAAVPLLEDEIDALELLIERCLETSSNARWLDLVALAETLFGDNVSKHDVITLASIHKAKGREWKRVFILGFSDYMPFHMAKKPHELEQEYNLIYVAKTRAEQTLFYVNGVQSAIDKGEHRVVKKQLELPASA